MFIGLGIFLLFFNFFAEAKDCFNVDLNKGAFLPKIKILDQSINGTCYSCASSQLLQYKLLDLGLKVSPSPIELASFAPSNSETIVKGGWIYQTLESVKKFGVVPDQCIEKAVENFTGSSTMSQHLLLAYLNYYFAKKSNNLNYQNPLDQKMSDVIDQKLKHRYQHHQSVFEVLQDIFSVCRNKFSKRFDFDIDRLKRGNNQDYASFITEHLKSLKPVGVEMCIEALFKRNNYDGLFETGNEAFSLLPRDKSTNLNHCTGHALLVVAQRINTQTKQCQLMMRNSWGTSWGREESKRGQSCACRVGRKYFADCPSEKALMSDEYLLSEFLGDKVKLRLEIMKRKFLGCWYQKEHIVKNTFRLTSLK